MPTSPTEPKETDLLVSFESENNPADYKEYYRTKRQNLFASIQGFPETWKYYILRFAHSELIEIQRTIPADSDVAAE